MVWRMSDYTSPRDTKATCSAHGCEMSHEEDSFECKAKACRHQQLCIGCVFTCADCSEDFCEKHTRDVNEFGETGSAVYLCGVCEGRRADREQKAA